MDKDEGKPCLGRRRAGTDPAKCAQILQGAAAVFTRDGFDAANVSDIAKAAGVSKGTIYVYFDDKLALFVAVMEDTRDRLFGELEATLDQSGPLVDRLRSYGRTLAETLTREDVIRAQRVLVGVLERVPSLGKVFAESKVRGQSILARTLNREVTAGRMAIKDVDMACNQFFELCLAGMFRSRLLGVMTEPPDATEIARRVDAAVAMFMAYYRAQ